MIFTATKRLYPLIIFDALDSQLFGDGSAANKA